MEWGQRIIHSVLNVTLCLHNAELLFKCISSSTQFTHFDNAHVSLCVCDALHLHVSAFHWWQARPSQCFKACIYLADFPQHLLPSCPCLLPPCSVSQTLCQCFHPPPFEGQSSSKQRAIPAEVIGSPGMKTQAVKLLRGISTSHYLVVSMHLTHSSLEELQCMTSRI